MRKIIMTKAAYKFHIGIDVSKTTLDIFVNHEGSSHQFSNEEIGFKELIQVLPNKKHSLIVMEATGGYEKRISHYLRKKKFKVAVVNARRVRDFAKACGKLAKTDKIDAQIICSFGVAFNPIPQELTSEEADMREQMIHRRSQIVKLITYEKQHLEHSMGIVRKQIKKHVAYLEQELEFIEEKLKDSINQDAILKEKMERLEEIKGVGEITAMNLLIHLPELGKLTNKEISSLAGVAPFNKDSGKRQGKRAISGGRVAARSTLYMAIMSAKKCNPALKRFYESLIARGKLKKVAMIACMRKLIIIMNVMIKNGTRWRNETLA